MKRKCICLFLWALLIALSYGGGYLCFAWPLSSSGLLNDSKVIPVTAGKTNYILPETRLVMETINLKTGEKTKEHISMPAIYLGLERDELVDYLNEYMENLSIKEREQGLLSFNIESYSTEEIVLRKTYYASDDFHKFYMIYKQGRMVVYYSDKKTVYDYPDIKLSEFPLDVQCQLVTGMEVKDEVELYRFLQNYSS